MCTRGQSLRIVATLAAAVAAACAEPVTTPISVLRGPVALVSPASGSLITQNDPTIGCPAHEARGYGFRLSFDWEDVVGADRYFVRLKHTGSEFPAVDHSVVGSSFDEVRCTTFVIDANLTDWVWRVAAVAEGSDGAAADTLWSEERTYGFRPCRHPDGSSCWAPPPPLPGAR